MAIMINGIRLQRIGPGALVAAAAVGLLAATVFSWTTLGLWTGSWATLLMIVAFNAGLVLGFAFRLPQDDSTTDPRPDGNGGGGPSPASRDGGGNTALRRTAQRRATIRSSASAAGLQPTGSVGSGGAIRRS